MSDVNQIEKLKKVIEVLESNHVSSVDAHFEYEADGIRYYNVFTRKGFEVHRYRVRVQDCFESGEKQTWARCNCHAGSNDLTCRHILKVAQVDAEKFNRDMHLDTFANYRAHRCYERKAAA